MRHRRAFKRGRLVSILVAGGIGYMAGVWHVGALRSTDISASQAVALRFPVDWQSDAAVESRPDAVAAAKTPVVKTPAVAGGLQFALLSPEPMVPQTAVSQTAVRQIPITQTVNPQNAAPQPPAPQASIPQAAAPVAEPKPAAAPSRRLVNRPGFVLNDAQIGSIKQRLHLTADQERMWPAVEAALRNMAYARARDAHQRGAPVSAAQLASADPNSVEVQGLKSAAIPLLMSFNDEQKDEVRNLAHVMGLDQLATQF